MDQEVDQFGREGLLGGGRGSSVGEFAVQDAGPELVLGDRQLVAEDVAPQGGAVDSAVDRVGDAGAQDAVAVQRQFVRDVVRAGAAPCVPDPLSLLDGAEPFVALAVQLRSAHRRTPTSQSVS